MNKKRLKLLKKGNLNKLENGPVLYWMSRDQRINDNWALLFAQELAIIKKLPLAIVFCLVKSYNNAPLRHYHFMLNGLFNTFKEAYKLNIPAYLIFGDPKKVIPDFVNKNKITHLITDFDPLKIKREWKKSVACKINCDFYEVDAHNIVPCWIASDKQEFAAYTIRPKINRLLGEFLEEYPSVKKMPSKNLSAIIIKNKNNLRLDNDTDNYTDNYTNNNTTSETTSETILIFNDNNIVNIGNMVSSDNSDNINFINQYNIEKLLKECCHDSSVKPVEWIKPGYSNAINTLGNFLENGIFKFKLKRNDPNQPDAVSNLSPYLHFGQISAQRVALETLKVNVDEENRAAFLEELIVRRELSDNFCYYNQLYDSFEGFPNWAKISLKSHLNDPRPYLYNIEELENCLTHDDLWNAAQKEMVIKGKMHGYMRMYWAKKILEWSISPEEALDKAIYLNDRYELDGRDPNGYTGIAWSIGGLHDRAWAERQIFGKIRYMSYSGCKNKFNVNKYIESVNKLV